MNKLILAFALVACAMLSSAEEIREVTFALGEAPATNPRIQRNAYGVVTQIEVFSQLVTHEDGTTTAKVIDTSADMSEVEAIAWVAAAKTRLGVVTRKYSIMKLLAAVGTLGEDKYDEAKAFMQSNRVGGVPIWDLVNTAQYITEDDPRLVAAKKLVVDGGVCPEELFNQLLAAAIDNE